MANPEFLHAGYTSPRTVKAKKMVILSAGANGTPHILERSGVGDAEVLKAAGVEVVQELSGVGKEYQVCVSTGPNLNLYWNAVVHAAVCLLRLGLLPDLEIASLS